MICRSNGDPHFTTFSGHRCDLQGRGVFPLVTLPGLTVQAYHCPATTGWVGASLNVAVAVSDGTDTVAVVGNTAFFNGKSLATQGVSTLPGGVGTVSVSSSKVDVALSGSHLTLTSHPLATTPTGYYMNVRIGAPIQPTTGYNASACTAEQNSAIPLVPDAEVLLPSSVLASISSKCGRLETDPFIGYCGKAPDACDVCEATGTSCVSARQACETGCPCADSNSLASCMFDFCAMKGSPVAAESCANADPCRTYPGPSPAAPPTPPTTTTAAPFATSSNAAAPFATTTNVASSLPPLIRTATEAAGLPIS